MQLEIVWQAKQNGKEEARKGEQEGGPHPSEQEKMYLHQYKKEFNVYLFLNCLKE